MNNGMKFIAIHHFYTKHPDLLTEHTIRMLVGRGEVPGLRVGNRFLINEAAFIEKLECATDTK